MDVLNELQQVAAAAVSKQRRRRQEGRQLVDCCGV